MDDVSRDDVIKGEKSVNPGSWGDLGRTLGRF